MASIEYVTERFLDIKNPTLKEYRKYLNNILIFVDENVYLNETLINSFNYHNLSGYKVLLNKYTRTSKVYNEKAVTENITSVATSFTKFIASKTDILNQEILSEFRAMIIYFTKLVAKDDILNSTELYLVTDHRLFHQIAVYEYMYSFFDKLNYIFLFLNRKINGKVEEELNSNDPTYFYKSIIENIQPFTNDVNDMFNIKKIIGMITNSSTWHYTRLLRNKLAHRNSDPNLLYNLSLSIKLLYINICRIVFLLDATIKKDTNFWIKD